MISGTAIMKVYIVVWHDLFFSNNKGHSYDY